MINKLHTNILPAEQLNLFNAMTKQSWLSEFYLAGGTALALQIGHRESIDFDFFTPSSIDTFKIKERLSGLGNFSLLTELNDTLYALVNNVKCFFITYKYPLVNQTTNIDNIKIASNYDIGIMKLEAISGRGAKKDFIDLFFLLNQLSLTELLAGHKEKYSAAMVNHYHLYKSLIYFNDAEEDEMPYMIEKIAWEEIKKRIVGEVKKIAIKG